MCFLPSKHVLLHKKIHSWGQKLLLCKHDECEHQKRLNFYTQYKISIKKEKNIKIKKTNANRKQQQQKINIIAKLGFEPQSLAYKAKIIATGVLYHMAS